MTTFIIRNTDDSYDYIMGLVQDNTVSSDRGTFTTAADRPENNVVFSFSGKTEEIKFTWWPYDDGTDKSNGTANGIGDSNITSASGDEVQTVDEQIYFLRQYIDSPTFRTNWELEGGQFSDYDGDGTNENTPVVIKNLRIRRISSNPTRAEATLTLEVGDVI